MFTLIAAVSLDGRITQGRKEGSDWTSREDKAWFHKELDRYDAVIMGRKTFDTIQRPLAPRNRIVFTTSVIPAQSLPPRRRGAGIQIPFCGSRQKLLATLKERNWTRITILGGTSVYDWFLKRGLISEIYLTLEPVIFGAGKPLTSKGLQPFARFRLASVRKLNRRGTLLLHYVPNHAM